MLKFFHIRNRMKWETNNVFIVNGVRHVLNYIHTSIMANDVIYCLEIRAVRMVSRKYCVNRKYN